MNRAKRIASLTSSIRNDWERRCVNRMLLAVLVVVWSKNAWAHTGPSDIMGWFLLSLFVLLTVILAPSIVIACSKSIGRGKKTVGFFVALGMNIALCALMAWITTASLPKGQALQLWQGVTLFGIAVFPGYVFSFWFISRFSNARGRDQAGAKERKS